MAHKKPKIQEFSHSEEATGYDIHEVMDFIQKKYGMNCGDIYNSNPHFNNWCDSKGYGKTDPAGKTRNSSNIWFAEYQDDPQGYPSCPKYVTVLDWFIEEYMPDQRFNEMPLNEEDFNKADTPDYIKQFYEYVVADFGKDAVLILSFED